VTNGLPPEQNGFSEPISIQGAALQESVIVAEFLPGPSLAVLRAYRLVLAWARRREVVSRLSESEGLREWEEELLRAMEQDTGLWAPLAIIAGEMSDLGSAEGEQLARACMALAEWGFCNGAAASGLLFVEAAALASPANPRLAYVTGRVLLERGRTHEAERWLRRAMRVAAESRDERAQALIASALQRVSGEEGA
jgi:Flp pilus assembly protein TadD